MNIFVEERQVFETDRFTVVSLSPTEGCKLAQVLLQDEALAAEVPWLTEKTQVGVLCVTSNIEQEASAGRLKMWSILLKELQVEVGAIIARNTPEGIDVEVLVTSQYWGSEVGEEAGGPVMDWLEENAEFVQDISALPILRH